MFTGLIQSVSHLLDVSPYGGDLRLTIAVGELPFSDVELGESIAVNGVCLTVVHFDANSFAADVSNETLARTTLGRKTKDALLNLERSLRLADRLGGHLVSGHIDGVGQVVSIEEDARSLRWCFTAPAQLQGYIAEKGSIAVDGVSLTVNRVLDNSLMVDGKKASGFEVNLVPHTMSHTAFSATKPGDAVNLEIDTVARYVARLMNYSSGQ